jgi:O-antigen ligase
MTIATALAVIVSLGMWTGLARAILGAPIYAFALDAATVGILFLAAWNARRDGSRLRIHPLDVLAAAYVAIAVVEIFNPNVPSPLVGAEGFRKTAFMAIGYAIARVAGGFDGERFLRLVAIGAVPALLWSIRGWIAPIGVEQTIIDSSGVSSTSFHSGTVLRAFAPTASPFHLGILAGSVAIVACVIRSPIRIWGTIAIIAAVALGLSLTRANIIATVVALGVVGVVHLVRRRGPRLAAIGGLVAALAIVVAVGAASSRPPYGAPAPPGGAAGGGSGQGGGIIEIDPTQDRSLRFRFQFWEAQLNAITAQPLIGYGTSAAADGFDRLYTRADSQHFEPHSVYLKVLLEQGIFGFVVFGLFLAGIGILALRGQRSDTRFDRSALGITVLLLVSGLTGPMLDAYPFNLLFWTVAGALVSRATAGAPPTDVEA